MGPLFIEVEKYAVAAFGGHDQLLEMRWIFSPDIHESINPSLVYSQSSHCHISVPVKAFRNKSLLSEGGGDLSDLRGLSKYWTWGGWGGGLRRRRRTILGSRGIYDVAQSLTGEEERRR